MLPHSNSQLTLVALIFSVICSFATASAGPLRSAFTYQGRLLETNSPASGLFDFEFKLFDAPNGGTQVKKAVLVNDLLVANGVFQAELDFGPNTFADTELWLSIGVRPGASLAAFELLPMRQAITAVPQSQYALIAGAVTDGSVTAGKIAAGAVTTDKIQDSAVTSAKIAAGQVVKSVNGIRDILLLEGGTNVTVTTTGNRIQIAAASGTNTAPLNAANVMTIVLANDGLGSGLNADLFDGKDSALFAQKVDVDDRVRRDGDTMNSTLTLQPPFLTQALTAVGNRQGSFGEAVAYFSNRQNATNVAPAVRIENTAGTSPDGAISISNNGQGYIARFGNSSKYVASLEGDGTLIINPNTGAEALVLSGNTTTDPLFRLRKDGFGKLATFGSQTEERLEIDYAGGIKSKSNIQAEGSLFVGGNAVISGNIAARNLPFLTSSQGDHIEAPAGISPDQDYKSSEVYITVPEPGHLFISSHVAFYGRAYAPTGATRFRAGMRLERVDAQGVTYLGADHTEQSPDVFTSNTVLRYEVHRVLRVDQPGQVRLRVMAWHGAGVSPTGATLQILQRGLNAIYFPL